MGFKILYYVHFTEREREALPNFIEIHIDIHLNSNYHTVRLTNGIIVTGEISATYLAKHTNPMKMKSFSIHHQKKKKNTNLK
jgi:hypothetical protein